MKTFHRQSPCRPLAQSGFLLAATILALWGAGPLRAQNLRLTEFLALNTIGIQDEDLTPQGWIEIWNPSITAKVAMNGLKLTDGTNRWIFPAVEIMPDERMLVWASGKDRRVLEAPLHTNFKIPAGGGTLQLLASATDTVLSQIAAYPAQIADVSYGRDEWDPATATPATLVGSYAAPSPGERNNYIGAGVSGKVLVDTPSKAFTGTITVTLSLAEPNAASEIRYTLTGGATPIGPVPTPTSTLYAGPISISATQILRARSFTPGLLPGETETTAYLLLNDATANFSSAMPIIALTNFLNAAPPDDGEQASYVWVWEPAPPDNRARMTNLPILTSRTIIDKRGSSTLGNPKFNLNLEMRKARDDDDRSVSLLGMPPHADWILGAPYSFDPSLIHNPLAYAMSNSIGRYAVRNRMAEVFIEVTRPTTPGATTPLTFTSTNNGDYFGIYNVSEKVRRDKDRVDVEPIRTYDNDPVKKTGGFIWKIDRADPGDSGFSAGGQGFVYYYPKEIDMKSPQRDPQEKALSAFLNAFNTALQGANSTNPTTGYAPMMDVPAALDHHLVNVWTFNVDAFRLSGYWHKQRGGKLVAGPVWDFDRALSSTDGRDSNPKIWKSASGDGGTDFFNYPWWTKLFRDPDFYQKYIDRWQALRRPGQPFSPTVFNALIDSLNGEFSDEAVFRDLQRWRNAKRSWTSPFGGTVYPGESFVATGANATTIALAAEGQRAEIQRLKDYMQQRADFFDTEWVAPVNASLPEGNVPVGSTVTLTTSTTGAMAAAKIYYSLNGTDPRPSWPNGGAAPPVGTLEYTGTPIVITSTTHLRARAYHATWVPGTGTSRASKPPLISKWGGLLKLRYATDPPAAAGNLVITEVNFHPAGPTATELAVNPLFDDKSFEFVELRNIGTTPIDLLNVQLTNAVTFAFTGENAVSIPPGGQIVVAGDPSGFAARYGAVGTVLGPWTGDLSNAGETLTLTAANGPVIMSLAYDDAWSLAADGGGSTLVVYDPKAVPAVAATAANWRTSQALNGSPAAYDPQSAPLVRADSLAGPFTAVQLAGVVDGGHANGPPTVAWSFLEGPGTATITPLDTLASTATFSRAGVYTLRLQASDTIQTNASTITVYATETPDIWLAAHAGIGGLADDFELDGRSNLLEFAMLTDPAVVNNGEPPVAGVKNGFITLAFPRLRPPSSLVYRVQISSDLVTFRDPNQGELLEEVIADQGLTQTVQYTDTVPIGSQPNRFLRVQVSQASP